jgi:sortase A
VARSIPALSPRLQLARATMAFVCIIAESLLLQLVIVSSVQQRASQQRAFEAFRGDLARGTAPVGPTGANDRPLPPGSPVAYIEIPSIGVKQVVVDGTSSSNLFTGPGHRRDTPLPGQPGVSVLLGRKAAYGGPFAEIKRLRPQAMIHVTTGQGRFDYRVSGVRREGERVPAAPAPNAGRLTLVTAAGRAFVPSGVLRVDADLVSPTVPGETRPIDAASLPAAEQIMGADTGTLWALALWLQALVLVVLGATWAWFRWGRARTWIVFLPLLTFVGISLSGEAARLLPNLL